MTDQVVEIYPLQGGCTCGKIRYQIETRPLFTHCCHCTWCQRETGSAFVLNAMIEADRVTLLQGDPQCFVTPSNSGKGQKIWRCGSCHVALWSNYFGAGDKVYFIRVGTLDNPNTLPPDIHIFTSTKQDWVVIADGQLTVDKFYDRERCWPEESLLRRERLHSSNGR
ncbi:GFA family protein [Microbulbifer spongiae]|uniref:GFA family protein n=1 Tax=Microbulbifer spongiae TaxID=2944933 RepID=A0ABY9EFW9_9GAMM|nr:GFA family protein [Microbulbifer sp. MI-G]WKD49671.1 GFA family protein [Microbulbifer sp. MI-G]